VEKVENPEAAKLDAYPAFDWLRFVLASIVALNHFGVRFPGPISGGLAVDVFLALSGWLIGGILLRTERSELPLFFFNRATRIWLPYFFTVTILYVVALLLQGFDLNFLKYLFYDSTFTHYTFTIFPQAASEMPLHNTGNHFWSISVEEQFYLAAPILMFGLSFGKRIAPWLIIAAVFLGVGSRFAPISLGVLAAILHKHDRRWPSQGWQVAMCAIAVCVFALLWRYGLFLFEALFSVALVVALAFVGRRNKAALWFGAISYPLYLNHWMGVFFTHSVEKVVALAPSVDILFSYLAALAVASVSWAFIDRRVMVERARWFTPKLGRRLGAIAYMLLGFGLAGGIAIRPTGLSLATALGSIVAGLPL
jgi:peptidoglycan/LPS O-acetylase OafA/YrhL